MLLYPLPVLMTLLSAIAFTTVEITGWNAEAANDANKAARNPPSCFFISCFTTLVTPSINTSESSNNLTVLIISSVSLFGMNKVNPSPTFAAPFPLILLLNLFIAFETAFEAILLINPGKLFLAKGIYKSVTTSLPNLSNQETRIHLVELFYIFELYL